MLVRTLATAAAFALVAAEAARDVSHLRRVRKAETRQLQSNNNYYHTLTSSILGDPNPDAAIGNPLKGLVESPIYTNPPYKVDVPLAVEFYYLGTLYKGKD
jgi:hypothetical protein